MDKVILFGLVMSFLLLPSLGYLYADYYQYSDVTDYTITRVDFKQALNDCEKFDTKERCLNRLMFGDPEKDSPDFDFTIRTSDTINYSGDGE